MKKADILKVARDRMAEAISADLENREAALNDLEFISGKQWPEQVRREREADGRPTPTINRLPRFVRQVTGDIRKLNPAIKILPADSAATTDVATIFEGLTRHIEADSGASSVYEGAAESAAQCGIGAFRVLAEYESDDSFDQVIKIRRIHNPMSVYWDPASREATRSDANFVFITDQMKAEDFKEMYPDAGIDDVDHDGETDGLEHWHEEGRVVVAEYIWKQKYAAKIALLEDGSVVEAKGAPEGSRTRSVDRTRVMWAKISGSKVLEGPKEVPCVHLPVIAVTGEEMHIGTQVVRTSVIRHAKDSQQIYNYYAAAQTEVVALQPKAPYLVTPKQIEGLERFWNEANKANRPYLPWNPDPKVGGAPQRVASAIASGGMMQEMMRAEDDMKATTGIYDAALGGRSNEQSGVAIRQRQLESDISTSIYTDNLSKAIEQCGRVLVDMIPRIYDTERTLRIIGDDDQETMVTVNQTVQGLYDVETFNALDAGRYDVRVTVGPNYTTRRQETAESMMQFVQAFPVAGQVAGDLIAKSMDWPDADKLAARLKKTLPPGIISVEDLPEEEQQQAAQQQQMAQQQQQQQQQFQQMMQQLEARKATAEASEAEADVQKTTVETEAAKIDVAQAQLKLALESGQINEMIGQIVQQQVIRVLQGTMQQGIGPI